MVATLSEAVMIKVSDLRSPFMTADPHTTAADKARFAAGQVRMLLRLEGATVLAATIAVYAAAGFSWPLFLVLFLAPDLAMFAYLGGPRIGAVGYNLVHTYVGAIALALAGFFGGSAVTTAIGLIWIAHIGFDRALGFGLKYPTSFHDTHLSRGRIGR
jgi:hypothetical protein